MRGSCEDGDVRDLEASAVAVARTREETMLVSRRASEEAVSKKVMQFQGPFE